MLFTPPYILEPQSELVPTSEDFRYDEALDCLSDITDDLEQWERDELALYGEERKDYVRQDMRSIDISKVKVPNERLGELLKL